MRWRRTWRGDDYRKDRLNGEKRILDIIDLDGSHAAIRKQGRVGFKKTNKGSLLEVKRNHATHSWNLRSYRTDLWNPAIRSSQRKKNRNPSRHHSHVAENHSSRDLLFCERRDPSGHLRPPDRRPRCSHLQRLL